MCLRVSLLVSCQTLSLVSYRLVFLGYKVGSCLLFIRGLNKVLNKVHLSLVLEKGQQVVLCLFLLMIVIFLLFVYHSWERLGRHTWANFHSHTLHLMHLLPAHL